MISEEVSKRKNRFDNIRASLKGNTIFQKNTIAVESKIEKRRKRKESLQIAEDMTESQLGEQEEEDFA